MASLSDLAGKPCPRHGSPITILKSGKALCDEDCSTEELQAWAVSLNGHGLKKKEPPAGDAGGRADVERTVQPQYANGHDTTQALTVWKANLFQLADTLLHKDVDLIKLSGDRQAEELRRSLILWTDKREKPPSFLTQTEALEEIDVVVRLAVGEIEPVATNQLPPVAWEDFDGALVANEEYLKRAPVIESLCYSNAVSMITGGKHAGKSTLARWMAICVAKGWPVLGREVTQGPVFYIASEDETMAARQELIRLGWNQSDPIRFYPASGIDDPDKFLKRLVGEIERYGVKFVVLDMLFDFVRIADEMSYAGTREALGKIQDVASQSGAHLVAIHHAPKNAMIGDAAVAALGSQGLAARVSPIILVRRFGPGVHSVSSTEVRDPRGKALAESRLVKNVDGSVTLGGAWKNYMLAEVYMERVKEFLDEGAGAEFTIADVMEPLAITYEVARSCLNLMVRQGFAVKRGDGKKGKPFRYVSISAANGTENDSLSPQVGGGCGENRSRKYRRIWALWIQGLN